MHSDADGKLNHSRIVVGTANGRRAKSKPQRTRGQCDPHWNATLTLAVGTGSGVVAEVAAEEAVMKNFPFQAGHPTPFREHLAWKSLEDSPDTPSRRQGIGVFFASSMCHLRRIAVCRRNASKRLTSHPVSARSRGLKPEGDDW